MLALDNVRLFPEQAKTFSHQFAPGELSVVLGANQAGKTNLCRLIAGLNTRATGQVRLAGEDLGALGVRQRPVAMVYQAFVNYPNRTVYQNIASPLVARNCGSAQLASTVQELAETLRIEDLLTRFPHELSGGQQQRVAIARALAKEARVLLLDEPLVNLDFKLREALEVELRELLRASRTVVIYTSSDPRDAFALGDQVLLLERGEKLQAGTPLAVYQAPDSLAAMELLADPGVNRFQRDNALCALRPEHLEPREGEAGSTDQLEFLMQVTAVETNGDESFIHGDVEGEEWVMRKRGMLPVTVGQALHLTAASRDLVRF